MRHKERFFFQGTWMHRMTRPHIGGVPLNKRLQTGINKIKSTLMVQAGVSVLCRGFEQELMRNW